MTFGRNDWPEGVLIITDISSNSSHSAHSTRTRNSCNSSVSAAKGVVSNQSIKRDQKRTIGTNIWAVTQTKLNKSITSADNRSVNRLPKLKLRHQNKAIESIVSLGSSPSTLTLDTSAAGVTVTSTGEPGTGLPAYVVVTLYFPAAGAVYSAV